VPTWIQHAIVIALAVAAATILIVRRIRTLSGRAPACDGCASGCTTDTKTMPRDREQAPIPPHTLVRRARS